MYGFLLTTAGEGLLARAVSGETLTITGVQVGKGAAASVDAAKALTALIDPVAEGTSSAPQINGGQISMIVEYRNDLGGGLETGFELTEFGIMAKAGDDSPTLLYYAGLGDSPQPVQPISQGLDVHRFPVAIAVTGEVSVTLGYPADAFLPAGTTVNGKTLPAVLTGTDIPVSGDAGADNVAAALSKKAPGGYGLGQTAPEVAENIDTIERTGLYLSLPGHPTQGTFPSSYVQGNSMILHLSYSWSEYAYQYYYLLESTSGSSYRGCVLCRTFDGSTTPGPWEWVNPPMLPGVEFRTTERYNGKPVYMKLVDCGAGPNNTRKTVSANTQNVETPISCTGTFGSGTIPYEWFAGDSSGAQAITCTFSGQEINIAATSDYSRWTVFVILKYTKTTD